MTALPYETVSVYILGRFHDGVMMKKRMCGIILCLFVANLAQAGGGEQQKPNEAPGSLESKGLIQPFEVYLNTSSPLPADKLKEIKGVIVGNYGKFRGGLRDDGDAS